MALSVCNNIDTTGNGIDNFNSNVEVPMKDLQHILTAMPEEQRRWIVGNETTNGLQEAFDYKRVVHAGVAGMPIMNPEEQQKKWQELMSLEAPVQERSLYIHVPFCETKCSYCGFFQNASKQTMLHDYTERVLKEMEMTASYRRATTGTINAVYFGGGTPSTLAADDIARLVKALKTYFPLANDCEITLESRIHDMTVEKIETVLEAGINRFSIGVQSFDTTIRQAVGRIDDEDTVRRTLERLLNYDAATVVIDLMFGLPYQTWDTWKRDLEIQFDMGLHGGDMYQLNVFPGSDLAKLIDKGTLPACMTTKEQAALYARTVELIQSDYPDINMFDASHWARTRRERGLYNTLAKRRLDMLSFGSSAGGALDGVTMMHQRNLNGYNAAIDAGMKPIAMMMDGGHDSQMSDDLKEQLAEGYIYDAFFQKKWNISMLDALAPVLTEWERKGLITNNGRVVRFTTAGNFWHDNLEQAAVECLAMMNDTKTAMPHGESQSSEGMMESMMAMMNRAKNGEKPSTDMIAMMKEMAAAMGMDTSKGKPSMDMMRQMASAMMGQGLSPHASGDGESKEAHPHHSDITQPKEMTNTFKLRMDKVADQDR